MQFLMLVCVDDQPYEAPVEPAGDVDEWVTTMDAKGLRIAGDRTVRDADVRSVRVRGGEVLVTDGPFLETKEALAGFDLLECRDLAEAIEVAAAHPFAASGGVMELRPVWIE